MEPVEKSLQAQECGPSYVFYIPIEVKAMLAPTSKIPEERAFVVDSGASMHMLSKKVLHSDELDTLRRSRNPTVVLTANGEVHNHEVARVHVHDLNVFVAVQLHEETPAEVHNHEESQVHVHDLNVFVTVQLHEETPAEVHNHEESQVHVHDLNVFVTMQLHEETPAEVHNHEESLVHVHDLNVFVTVQLHEETPAEVHNHEESQVHVHDLNVFVTVQLLEETPAVLSLGKNSACGQTTFYSPFEARAMPAPKRSRSFNAYDEQKSPKLI